MAEDKKSLKRFMSGVVISDKMDKTVVVKSERTYKHERLGKTMRSYKNYKVHDENSVAKVGDVVEFYEGRPASKTKYMYLERVVRENASARQNG